MNGRSSILFATLAGVSLGLSTGGPRPPSGAGLGRARLRVVIRALLIWLIGVLLISLDVPAAIILPTYAVIFVLALPLLAQRASRLFLAAAIVVLVASPVVVWANASPWWESYEGWLTGLYIGWNYLFPLWVAFTLAGLGHAALGERVRAGCFECGGEAEHFTFGVSDAHDLDNLGFVAGERARLVEGDGADRAQLFERLAGLDHDAVLGGGADRADHGDRNGDRERARGSGDEDDKGALDPGGRISHDEAEDDDEGGDDEHGRHERLSDPVGEPGAFSLAGVRLLDEGDDLRERVVATIGGGLDEQCAGAVHCAGRNRLPRMYRDRDGLPGDGGGVDAGCTVDHDAVGGDALSRTDDEDVEFAHLGDGERDLAAQSGHACGVGDQ